MGIETYFQGEGDGGKAGWLDTHLQEDDSCTNTRNSCGLVLADVMMSGEIP